MPKVKVMLWKTQIGILNEDIDNKSYYSFKYDEEFVKSGIEVCPIMMPLRKEPYKFENLSQDTFKGLVPLVVDSLPDRYGNVLLNAWVEENNKIGATQDEILLFIGCRGMGALEFEPCAKDNNETKEIDIDLLLDAAKKVLNNRKEYKANMDDNGYLKNLIDVGSSVGGARAKAVIAINEKGEIRSGQIAGLKGFKYYLIKFDGVNSDISDEEKNISPFTRLEYVYYRIAKDCDINIRDCRLLEVNGNKHFLTERFDRDENGEKIHMLSLAGMAGFDYKEAGRHSYEEVAMILKRLNCDSYDIEQLFTRMVFNIVGKNNDDHVKNISFLMNKKGEWSLSPAYDLTYSYNPEGPWTRHHQMTINNKVDNITKEDILLVAKKFGIKNKTASDIIMKVEKAFKNFEQYAKEENIPTKLIEKIKENFTFYNS